MKMCSPRSAAVIGCWFILMASIVACMESPTREPSPSAPGETPAPTNSATTTVPTSPSIASATPSAPASPVEHSLVLPGPNPGTAVPLRILDLSGALAEARQATQSEVDSALMFPDTIAIVGLPGDDRSLYARWTSSICEGETTVRVDAAIRTIEVEQPPREECDAAGTYVDLVLTFDREIDGDSRRNHRSSRGRSRHRGREGRRAGAIDSSQAGSGTTLIVRASMSAKSLGLQV